MTLEAADRLARVTLRQRLGVKPRENVTIEAFSSTLPWAAGFVREARRIGANPLVHFEDEASYWAAVREGRASLIGAPGDHEWAGLGETDVYIYFWGPTEIERRARLSERVREQLTSFNSRWYDEARKAGLRGARMGIAWVTERNASLWGVPLARWRSQMLDASARDPETLRPAAERVRRALSRGRSLRLTHANGTDLTLGLRQRPAFTGLGEVTPATRRGRFGMLASVPDANVFTAVDESVAEGTLVANRASAHGRAPVRGGRWRFEGGRLRAIAYSSGASGLRAEYRGAGAGRDRPSFLEVGLDPALRGTPLLEESELGAITVGVGGNSSFGGTTKLEFFTFLTVAGADLSIDGRPLVRGGRIVPG